MIEDKCIVITGASSGIGAELCRQLADNNRILAIARRVERIPTHHNIIPLSCDVSSREGMDRIIDEAYSRLGNIDIMISNAGFAYYERWMDADWEHMDSIFRTNVYAPSVWTSGTAPEKGLGELSVRHYSQCNEFLCDARICALQCNQICPERLR